MCKSKAVIKQAASIRFIQPWETYWPGFYEAEVGQGRDAGSNGAIITVEEIRKYWY